MRVLYLSQYFPPEIGATQSRAVEMVEGLARAGHSVTVLCEVPNHPHGVVAPGFRRRLFVRRRLGDSDVIHVWVKTSPDKTRGGRIAFYLSFMCMAVAAGAFLARGRYDLVYCTSPPLFAGAAALILRFLKRAPLVFEVRDLWPDAAVELGELRSARAIAAAARLERACYRRARAVVVVTRSVRERLIERGVPAGKVVVIPNGVNTDTYRPLAADDRLRERLGLRADHFVAVYTGLHGLAHGLETIIHAAHLLRDEPRVRILMIGEGPRKAALRKLASDLGLSNVVFHPAVREEELPSYLALADVGLDCRRAIELSRVTLPVKMFSYMACEVPVILCIEGEAVDILRESGAGIALPPENPGALADAIRARLDNRKPPPGDPPRARAYVAKHYSRQALARQLAGLLENLPRT